MSVIILRMLPQEGVGAGLRKLVVAEWHGLLVGDLFIANVTGLLSAAKSK